MWVNERIKGDMHGLPDAIREKTPVNVVIETTLWK
jgi:hypothetical protein